MTRERIEGMREVILPFVKKRLLETNYEGLGKSDAEEFTRDFNEILDLATKALEQETVSKEVYDHEYFLRKEFEVKIDKLERAFDKIRAEIEEYKSRNVFGIGIKDLETGKQVALDNVLGIINEYRAESEG